MKVSGFFFRKSKKKVCKKFTNMNRSKLRRDIFRGNKITNYYLYEDKN